MNRRKQILFSVLLLFGLIALVFLVRPANAQEQTQTIVAAIRDVPSGSILTAEDLQQIEVPAKLAQGSFYSTVEQAVGLWINEGLYEGEWLYAGRTYAKPQGLNHWTLGENMRLLTLALPPEAANGYWLAAGNRVDLDVVSRDRTVGQIVESFENIEVVAVLTRRSGENLSDYPAGNEITNPMVCLAVTRSQALRLAEAAVHCDIRLSVVCR